MSAFEHAVDEDSSLWTSYGITAQPSFLFIDGSGETSRHVGALGVDGLQTRLDELLAS